MHEWVILGTIHVSISDPQFHNWQIKKEVITVPINILEGSVIKTKQSDLLHLDKYYDKSRWVYKYKENLISFLSKCKHKIHQI